MSKLVFASASVVDQVKDPKRWNSHLHKSSGKLISANTKIPLDKYPPDEYLFTHSTIVSSVDVEKDPTYYIIPDCSKFVNANGDAWTRGVIAKTYKTFIGAPNYLEHVQVPMLSKGVILAAALREIPNSLYVDILVATNRIHKDLVSAIEAGRIKTMSMGALVQHTQCTKCGNISYTDADSCICVRADKNSYFTDRNGVSRIAAELCGDENDPESNTFIEASWVVDPAFKGAVVRSIVNPTKDLLDKLATLEKTGKVVDSMSAKKKVAYAIFLETPSGVSGPTSYPYFMIEPQTRKKPSKKEDQSHSVETASDEPKIEGDEEWQNKSVFVGKTNTEFDKLLISKFNEGKIYFKDILDFADFYTTTFGKKDPKQLNEIVKMAIQNNVIKR